MVSEQIPRRHEALTQAFARSATVAAARALDSSSNQPASLRTSPRHTRARESTPRRWRGVSARTGALGPRLRTRRSPASTASAQSASTAGAPPRSLTASDVENATLGVGAAGRAHGVGELRLTAARAGHQRGSGCLPLRTAVPGVGAGGLPLGNGHVNRPSLRRAMRRGLPSAGRWSRGCVRDRRRAEHRTWCTSPNNPPGTSAQSAV